MNQTAADASSTRSGAPHRETDAGTAAGDVAAPRKIALGLLIATVLLGVGLRLKHYAAGDPYWHDEASLVVNVFEKTARQLLGRLEMAQAAPPGFLLLERGVHVWLGRSELAMRLPPMLVALAGMLLFARLAWRTVAPAAAVLLAFLFACSERLIWHAAEAKQYSFDVFVALLLLWFALDDRNRSPARRLALCSAVAAVAVWFSHATVFLYGGVSLALLPALQRRGRREAFRWVACNALFAVSFVTLYFLSIRHQQVSALYTYWADRFVDFSRPWFIPIWVIVQLVSICNYALDLGGPVLMPLAVLGGYVLARTDRRQELAILILPATLVLLAAALHQYPFTGSRLTLFLTPGAFLLAGVGVATLWQWAGEAAHRIDCAARVGGFDAGDAVNGAGRRRGVDRAGRSALAVAVPGYLLVVAAWSGAVYLFVPPGRGNMAAPAGYIARHDEPGDRIYSNRVSEFLCYWPGAPVRDAAELKTHIPRGRFWLALSYVPERKDRAAGPILSEVEAEALQRDVFTVAGGAALLFEGTRDDRTGQAAPAAGTEGAASPALSAPGEGAPAPSEAAPEPSVPSPAVGDRPTPAARPTRN